MTQVSPVKNSKDMVDLQLMRFTTSYARGKMKNKTRAPITSDSNNVAALSQ